MDRGGEDGQRGTETRKDRYGRWRRVSGEQDTEAGREKAKEEEGEVEKRE